jgi:hypothetical protein
LTTVTENGQGFIAGSLADKGGDHPSSRARSASTMMPPIPLVAAQASKSRATVRNLRNVI